MNVTDVTDASITQGGFTLTVTDPLIDTAFNCAILDKTTL